MSAVRRTSLRMAAVCVALVTASGGVSACSRSATDTKPAESQAVDHPSGKPKTPTTGTAGHLPTLSDYIKQNDIKEAQAKQGDHDVPEIILPMLPGWRDAGPATPAYARGAIISDNPAFQADPPSIVAVLSKLTGDIDTAEVLKLAPNEVRNLPEFHGADPQPGKLGNFDAVQIAGTYTRDGKTRLIAQKTIVIPGKDGGVFVLQLNADGVRDQDQMQVLAQATDAIDKQVTIKAAE